MGREGMTQSDTTPAHSWLARRLLAVAGTAGLGLLAATATAISVGAAPSPSPGWPSAIPNESVSSIAVSPTFMTTGFALAETTVASNCSGSSCYHLWVTHDGGASWGRAAATGWQGGFPVIVDGGGHDVLLAGTKGNAERSDDGGETWHPLGGGGGVPSAAPTFAKDGSVAVAGDGNPDYMATASGTRAVTGSGGSLVDISFMLAPDYPSSGSRPPALLSAGDPQTGLPVVQQCDVNLNCQGRTTFSGAATFSLPVNLLPSSAYAQDGVVFAQTGRGIYKSTDGGSTFTPLPVGASGATTTVTPELSLAPGYREAGPTRTAYVAVLQAYMNSASPQKSHTAGGIYRSTDGGSTWTSVSTGTPFDTGATAVAVAPDGRVFAAYTGAHPGLLCSWQGQWRAQCPAVGAGAHAPAGAAGTTGAQDGAGACGAGCAGAVPEGGSSGAATGPGGGAAGAPDGSSEQGGAGGTATAPTATHSPSSSHPFVPFLVALAIVLGVGAGWRALASRRRHES